jgi:hypothetical protein
MRRPVLVCVVSGYVVVIEVAGGQRCRPPVHPRPERPLRAIHLDQARRRDPRQSHPRGNFINVTLATLASILTSLFLLIFGRRGITIGGQAARVTLGLLARWSSGSGSHPLSGQPGQSTASASPQKPHNSAIRRPIPTGIPRTKRHTPIQLLAVLKVRKIVGQQRRCA